MNFPSSINRKPRLFCFPFAGGASYSYRELDGRLASHIRVTSIDLPGHGRRMDEPLLTDLHDMADDAFHRIRHDLGTPYAFYGHSLGSMLCFLVARRIAERKMPPPIHLFVSGRGSPSAGVKDKDVHLLPGAAFMKKIADYGGTAEETLAEDALMAFMEPILRADFQAAADYRHAPSHPLSTPITVMNGLTDDVSDEDASTWREATDREVSVRWFPGGHFFIFDHLPEISGIILKELAMDAG